MATGSDKTNNLNGSGKRTFRVIRTDILKTLCDGQNTINHISNATGINWKTVENHLVYLIGRGLVNEVFSSEYVRIFELTEEGKDYVLRETPVKRVLTHKLFDNRLMISKKARL